MANKTVWSPACRRRRWCKSTDEATTSDEDLLSDAGIDVDDDEIEKSPVCVCPRYGNQERQHHRSVFYLLPPSGMRKWS
ncbi:hypothetical protein TNCV_1134261 [Trichonephila clavipes]|nr:hypothetical protein TNCV_1134261 [Trichonephila clavipes]